MLKSIQQYMPCVHTFPLLSSSWIFLISISIFLDNSTVRVLFLNAGNGNDTLVGRGSRIFLGKHFSLVFLVPFFGNSKLLGNTMLLPHF
jgi:hypothetical protein